MKEGKYLILCVDDDPDILDALQALLASGGYATALATSAEEGLKQYKSHRPDLIIVDLMMEEVDAGANFVKELSALGNQAPVYLLTSIGDVMASSIDVAELGLSGVFQKPIGHKLLLDTLATKLKS